MRVFGDYTYPCQRPIVIVLPPLAHELLMNGSFELPGYVQERGFDLARGYGYGPAAGHREDLHLLQVGQADLSLRPTRLVFCRQGQKTLEVLADRRCSGLHSKDLIDRARVLALLLMDRVQPRTSGHRALAATRGLLDAIDNARVRYCRRRQACDGNKR